jgi:hypothetical protein
VSAACDHFTRVRLGGSKLPTSAPVVGLLFGLFDGTSYSVCDNTDVVLENVNGEFCILDSDIERRKRLWTTVYQSFRLIGWYSFGDTLLPIHEGFNRSILPFAADPIVLLFDSHPNTSDFDKIPIKAFKPSSASGSVSEFVSVPFKIDSPEVEKIAVDEIIQSVPHGHGSALESFNNSASVSLTALERKLAKIIDRLTQMHTGVIEWDAEFARNAAAVVQGLERMNSFDNLNKIDAEVTDSTMSLYLGSATKSLATVQGLQAVYSVLYNLDRDSTSRK